MQSLGICSESCLLGSVFVYDYQFDWVGNPLVEGKPKPKVKPRVIEKKLSPERLKERLTIPERLCPLNTGERLLSKIRETHLDMTPSEVLERVAEARKKRLRRGPGTASCAVMPTLSKLKEERLPKRGNLKPSSSAPGNLVLKNLANPLGHALRLIRDQSPLCSMEDLAGLDLGNESLPVLEDSPIAQAPESPLYHASKLPSIDKPSLIRIRKRD